MKIVITGGAGYIGSSLCHLLSQPEFYWHEVDVYDNLYYNQGTLVSPLFTRKQAERGRRINFFKENILDWSDNLEKSIEEAHAIIPLAALVGAPLCDQNKELAQNLNSVWFQGLAKRAADKLIIYPNTNSGYGSTGDEICTEETPTNPLSLYAQSKSEAEDILLKLTNRSIVFRLATVFGSSFRTRTDLLVNNLTKVALEQKHLSVFDGHFRRNYIHIKDICNAFIFALQNSEKMIGQVFNLGNDQINTTKLGLVQKVCEQTGATYSEDHSKTDPDKRDYVVSSQKLYDLGFRPEYDLDHGIEEMKRFYNVLDPSDEDKCKNY
jgi:nucleoside-diphosphate-sugar epimerase